MMSDSSFKSKKHGLSINGMLLVASMLLLNVVTARKTYLVKTERNLLTSPSVRSYDYSYCPTKNDDSFICLDMGADLTVGWQWYQKQVPDSYYQIAFQLYSEQAFDFHPEYSVPRFMYIENTYTLPTFQEILGVEIIYYYTPDYLCINIYRQNEYFDYQMLAVVKTMACFKNIINCFYDYSQWTGTDAKWFNGCAQSSKEEITIYQYTKEKTSVYYRGADYVDQVYDVSTCSPGTGVWPFLMFGPVVEQGGRPNGTSSQIGAGANALFQRMILNMLTYMTQGRYGSGSLYNLKK